MYSSSHYPPAVQQAEFKKKRKVLLADHDDPFIPKRNYQNCERGLNYDIQKTRQKI